MPDARAYPLVDQTALFYQASTGNRIPSKLSEAILRATNLLALICLVFGASCAALIPASFEQRLGSLFFFGFAPAVCLHAGGYIVSLLLAATSKVCAWVATQCFRFTTRLLSGVATWLIASTAGTAVLLPLGSNELKIFTQNAFASLHHICWRVDAAVYQFACWTIRSVAQLLISLEAWRSQRG
jgi:hypothetical protein